MLSQSSPFLKLLAVLMLMGLATELYAQTYQKMLDRDSILYKQHEFSGIACRNDTLFLLSEKCNLLFLFRESDQSLLGSEELNLPVDNIELEGLALYGEWVLMLDEHKENQQKVWAYNLRTKRTVAVFTDINNQIQEIAISSGIEGITTDTANGICYILEEKNRNNKNMLFALKISISDDQPVLSKISSTTISHSAFGMAWRFTDICFDKDSGKLYLLRSHYTGKIADSRYFIDHIPAPPGGMFNANQHYQTNAIKLHDVSDRIRSYSDSYENNIEGIYKNKHNFYLVSDNIMTRSKQCLMNSKKPALLLKVRYAHP